MEMEKHLLQIDTKSIPLHRREEMLMNLREKVRKGQVQFHSSMKGNLVRELGEIRADALDKVAVRPLCLASVVEKMTFEPGAVFYLTKVTDNGVYGIFGKPKK